MPLGSSAGNNTNLSPALGSPYIQILRGRDGEMVLRELLELQAEMAEREGREVNQGHKDQEERQGNKDLQEQRVVELRTPGGERYLVLMYRTLS